MIANTAISFWSGKVEYRCLSNFWERDVVIKDDGMEYVYESGEHTFHGEKYRRLGKLCKDENRKMELLEYSKKFLKGGCFKSCIDSKKGGGKKGLLLNEDEIKLWNSICIDVQNEICVYKFDTYEEVRNTLYNSGGSILTHTASRCSEKQYESRFWEGKMVERDGVNMVIGGNKLGECWMDLRKRLMDILDV
jgi:predicted NAD-dependent protein-ADP-ribosyltransferase YbiA (DUF1768 family)